MSVDLLIFVSVVLFFGLGKRLAEDELGLSIWWLRDLPFALWPYGC